METKNECMLLSFFLMNFMLVWIGILQIGLASWFLSQEGNRLLIDLLSMCGATQPVLTQLSYCSIAIGCFTWLTAGIGFSAVVRRQDHIVTVLIYLLTGLILMELILGIVAAVFYGDVSHGVIQSMRDKLLKDYTYSDSDRFTRAIDFAQVEFQCCGIRGHKDYLESEWFILKLGGQDLQVALTCCVSEYRSDAYLNPLPKNRTLCQSPHEHEYSVSRYIKGCQGDIEQWFKQESTLFIVLGLGIGLLDVAGIPIAVFFRRNLKNV